MIKKGGRYTSNSKRLYDFMDKFWVHCPKCNNHAVIVVPEFLNFRNSVLKCNHCHFSESLSSRTLFSFNTKMRCNDCSSELNPKPIFRKKIPSYIIIKCKDCNASNKIRENWIEVIDKYVSEEKSDPVFGLPLWLRSEFKGEQIWAYNSDHLLEIKSYISANLRERTTHRYKMTMVEKLPNFMKSAKNRQEVLLSLNRMLLKKILTSRSDGLQHWAY